MEANEKEARETERDGEGGNERERERRRGKEILIPRPAEVRGGEKGRERMKTIMTLQVTRTMVSEGCSMSCCVVVVGTRSS